MNFSNDTSVFIPEYCVSDNPIRYECPRTPTNDYEYYHDTTRNDSDPATVELRLRPRTQSNTIHPDEFKRFKLVVALSWRFPNSRGTKVEKNANPCTRKVYSWILYGCKGNSMVYLKPLYSRLDRLALRQSSQLSTEA